MLFATKKVEKPLVANKATSELRKLMRQCLSWCSQLINKVSRQTHPLYQVFSSLYWDYFKSLGLDYYNIIWDLALLRYSILQGNNWRVSKLRNIGIPRIGILKVLQLMFGDIENMKKIPIFWEKERWLLTGWFHQLSAAALSW